MRYRLGLDIGIASIGWSIIRLDDNGIPTRIEDLGVRIFNPAENPKNGQSLTLPRRIARGTRRRLRRRRFRLKRLRDLFINEGLLTEKEVNTIYKTELKHSVWYLRYTSLNVLVTNVELFRICNQIIKRRGFKSNRKSDNNDKDEQGKQLKGISENEKYMYEKGYRTIGEMFYLDEKYADKKRNTFNEYSLTLSRKVLREEINIILVKQQLFGNKKITNDFIKRILDIFDSQRPFASNDMIEKLIGQCTLDPTEKRAPKATYTFERFILINKINSLRIYRNGKYVALSAKERKELIELAYKQKEVKFSSIRKLFNLNIDDRFKGLTYSEKDSKKTEDTRFIILTNYHEIKKLFENNYELFEKLTNDDVDDIAIALTLYKTDEDIEVYLSGKGINQNVINLVLNGPSFSKVGHLSLKAMKKIMPFIESGEDYDKACTSAGYNFQGNKKNNKETLLPIIPEEDITSPVVLRTLTQTRKVINAIIREFGSPETIHIELARDMSHTFDERTKMKKSMEDNQKKNEIAIDELCKQYKFNPKGLDIVKQKLWTEQQGRCMYSNTYIDPTKLFEPGYVDVDHIIPYSRSFDDSYNNKVLVLSSENRQKGNLIPYEYFGNNEKRWHEFEERITSNNYNSKKKYNFLRKHFNLDDQREFMSRNLNDTRYATRYLMNFLEDNLMFSESGNYKRRVFSINGPVTSFMRKRWGLTKVREDNDRHHALDATVVALTSPSMIQKVTKFTQYNETKFSNICDRNKYLIDPYTGEMFDSEEKNPSLLEHFPMPWVNFRDDLEIRLYSNNPIEDLTRCGFKNYSDYKYVRPLFISRMPYRRLSGKAHQDTIFSAKLIDDGYKVIKKKLSNLSNKIFDANGDFPMYGKESDPFTYQVIKDRFLETKDVSSAFINPLYKPKSNGQPGPLIKGVKIIEKSDTGVLVHGGNGVADNESILRVDVFKKNNRFYIIPIYVADTLKQELPNRVIKSDKPRKEWPILDETYEFIFSLQSNDLVKITKTTGEEIFGYYRKCPGNQNAIFIDNHDINDSNKSTKYGVSTLLLFEKYYVDVLGKFYKIKKENRNGLEKHRN